MKKKLTVSQIIERDWDDWMLLNGTSTIPNDIALEIVKMHHTLPSDADLREKNFKDKMRSVMAMRKDSNKTRINLSNGMGSFTNIEEEGDLINLRGARDQVDKKAQGCIKTIGKIDYSIKQVLNGEFHQHQVDVEDLGSMSKIANSALE